MVLKRAVVQAVAVVARVAAAVQPAAAVAVVQVAGVAVAVAAPVRAEAAAVKGGAAATATAVKAAVAGTVIAVIASVKVESARLIAAQVAARATGVVGATEAGTGIATAIETKTVTEVVIMIEIGTRIGTETGIATEIAIGTARTKAQGFTTPQTMETIATVPTPTSAAIRTAYLRAPVMDGAVKASIRNARTSTDAVTLVSSQSSARAIRISRHIGTVFYAATRKASRTDLRRAQFVSAGIQGRFFTRLPGRLPKLAKPFHRRELSSIARLIYAKRPCGVNLTTMKATNREPEIVTRNGKPVSVILPIKEYEELLERAEDSEDVVWLRRARRKKLHYRPLEDYLAK